MLLAHSWAVFLSNDKQRHTHTEKKREKDFFLNKSRIPDSNTYVTGTAAEKEKQQQQHRGRWVMI